MMSLARISVIGFKPFMAVQVVLFLILLLTWLFSKRLPYLVRTGILLLMIMGATFAALSQIGPVSDNKVFVILFSFTCMLFLSSKVVWILVVLNIGCFALFGFAAVQHWIRFELDYQIYAYHPLAWMISVWTLGYFSTLVAYIGWRMVYGLWFESAEQFR